MLERLDARALKRIGGPSWEEMRPLLTQIHSALVSVSPDVSGELTTIYVKYTSKTDLQPFAVLWVKKSTEVVLGLALPADYRVESPNVIASSLKYAGLTIYLRFGVTDEVPSQLAEWARAAYQNIAKVS